MEQFTICGYCNNVFHNPILLSCCGETICETDLESLYLDSNKKDSIRCPFDDEIVPIPQKGFPVNKRIIKMLNTDINEDHAEANKNMSLLLNEINEYESLVKHPEDYVHEYFSEIQRKIDLRCELIRHEINKHQEELTKKITDLRDKCKKESKKLKIKAYDYKREAELLGQDMKVFSTDKEKWIKINTEIEIKLSKIETEIVTLKTNLIDCEIDINEPSLNVIDVVGEFKMTKKNKQGEFSGKIKNTLEGHTKYVRCLTVLPSGDLASGSADYTIKIWDTANGKLKNTLEGHKNYVLCLTVLPSGDLASGSKDNTIKIWDKVDGKLKNTLKVHSESISCLSALPSGDLASGSWDCTIKIWDTANGKLKNTLEGHTSYVSCLTVLPNGDLASGSWDCTFKIWDTENGELKNTLKGHSMPILYLTVLPCEDLASSSWDCTIKIWDTENGKLKNTLEGHTHYVLCLTVLPCGDLASASMDCTIKIWDTENGELKNTLKGHTSYVSCLTVLPSGDLASGSWDNTIKVWS